MIYLVSCVSSKKSTPALAKDLYISQWFLKARAFVESTGCSWFILSAEHGLLDPNKVVAPYEKTLNNMQVRERREWAGLVMEQAEAAGIREGRVALLAGQRYREFVGPQLSARGIEVEVPMQGLRIGEQLKWLGERVSEPDRLRDLKRFYELVAELERRLGGYRQLWQCDGRMGWPNKGVYFFFEAGEERTISGSGDRVVRVGTHALTSTSKTSLWNRLSQHKGSRAGSGNHRGSIFRLLVGKALISQKGVALPSWGQGSSIGAVARKMSRTSGQVKDMEAPLEQAVSAHIGAMPMLWLEVNDEPSSASMRGFIERNAIALLSTHNDSISDPASDGWLGHHSDREKVRRSGLWNQNHVDEQYDSSFLDQLEHCVGKIEPCSTELPRSFGLNFSTVP